jgi:tRNA(Ile)-lysidine synthase
LLRAGDRVGVAVSGGIDSVALLRLLLELRQELGIVVSVAHFNHKLRRAESDADQAFVEGLAREHGLEFYCESGDAAELASHQHSGLEAAARELRYGFFQRLLGAEESDSEIPQRLKPQPFSGLNGTAEAVPLPNPSQRSPSQQSPTQQNPSQQNLSHATTVNVPFQGQQNPLDKIVTGHTQDDQAETVLMRIIRGTGPRGLGGIYPRIVVEHEDGEGHGEIVRPLLGIRRHELGNYLESLKQPWREDSTNTDCKFTRNRVRKLVLPLLEREFNPSIVDGLSELAEIARDEEDYWENEISGWLGTVVQWSQPEWARGLPGFDHAQSGQAQSLVQIQPSPPRVDPELMARLEQSGPALMDASVSRPWLLTEPKAVQRRVLRAVADQAGIPLEFKHIEEILRFATEDGPAGKELSLPLGWKISREPEALVFRTPDLRRQERIPDYEYLLPVPGRVLVPELGGVIEALLVPPQAQIAEYNPQQLLRADLLQDRLVVRNWHAGDRFWPAHTKAPKKVKEFLQELHLPQPARRLWPVVVSGDEIVWMRGFPVPARLRARAEQEALVIQETQADQVDVI